MNTPSTAVAQTPPAVPAAPTRPFLWSVRRELWENRSIYLVPLIAAGVALLAFLWGSHHPPENIRAIAERHPELKGVLLSNAHDFVAIVIIMFTGLVGAFYCLEALHGERRDRSILFWKSLPVSDLTTVLSKAAIPLVVLPVLAFVIILATQLLMLLSSSLILLAGGESPALLWEKTSVLRGSWVLIYGLVTLTLWNAPVYAWLLLVSAWAQRAAILWAVLPPLAVAVVERIAFHTTYIGSILRSRLSGGFAHAFVVKAEGNRSRGQ